MFLKARSYFALKRTTPHQEDWRVRLTSNPEDLIAIHHPDVRAVIWERGLSKDVIDALKELKPIDYIKTAKQTRKGPETTSHPFSIHSNFTYQAADVPKPILKDMIKLNRAFVGAAGHLILPCIVKPEITCQAFGEKTPHFKKYITQSFTSSSLPHIDGGLELRLVSTYTLNKDYTTEWYPCSFSYDEEVEFRKLISKSPNPEQIKRDFNVQYLRPGDVLALKGDIQQRKNLSSILPWIPAQYESARHPHELLMHNMPAPQANSLRFTYLSY